MRVVLRSVVPLTIASLTTLVTLGCNDAFTTASRPEPFLYLVVSRGPLLVRGPYAGDSAVRALLLTVAATSGSSLRHAERFQLIRARDDSVFTIQESSALPDGSFLDTRHDISVDQGNYMLPFAPLAGLGGRDVNPLETYRLEIETGGSSIAGSVTMPAMPQPVMMVVNGTNSIVFRPVAGAAGYVVDVDTDRAPARLVTDTVIPLHYDRPAMTIPPNPEFRIVALDPNLFRYVSDTTVARAGITGALGVLGAATAARLLLPPP